ncbi:Transcriptional regulators, LysR family (plasmid) [Roseomonas mucosa]|uniref:Cyn operon transcriptional activator n=1 Tax=Roseomonas mucosa TaxID=207340 RepID=A0A1S8D1L6_9PROT|nr:MULTISPECIES: LysR family transcriptional regulator [Roseomonas]MBS5903952.1 LysR family transcriptional regulator [Acetobacteraceae bacterium]MCG7351467.1 LysR family transcriptional regulator [Roseomonas mucosa]MCG7357226.1 LysR family transcriptional regulator [Roseomonas mucosa]MDT8291084.1 LysR family transcriptional regulator [Roseomonas mucosa]MDT8296056.1 LysR family transcriptional regulator [Roseomonas mucosa]
MNPFQADWTTLRILLATVELGSITQAAQRCGIATSAAAKRLQLLERDCGLPLLERGARGVRPTAAGEAIAQHARALFDLSARFAGDFRAFASGGQGSVRLGASASVIAGHDLGALLAGFAARYPAIRVELKEETSGTILHDLVEGRGDLGLITSASEILSSLEARPWRRDRLVVLCRADHPLATARSLRFGALLEHPLIGVQEGGALSLILDDAARRLGHRLEFRFQVGATEAARGLVAAGLGLAVVPEGLAGTGPGTPALCAVPLEEGWARRQLRLITRPAAMLPPAARLLRDHLARPTSADGGR